MAIDIVGEDELWRRAGGRNSETAKKWRRKGHGVPADKVIADLLQWWEAKADLAHAGFKAGYEAARARLNPAPNWEKEEPG